MSEKIRIENTWWGRESLVRATLERRRAREVKNAAKNIKNIKMLKKNHQCKI